MGFIFASLLLRAVFRVIGLVRLRVFASLSFNKGVRQHEKLHFIVLTIVGVRCSFLMLFSKGIEKGFFCDD